MSLYRARLLGWPLVAFVQPLKHRVLFLPFRSSVWRIWYIHRVNKTVLYFENSLIFTSLDAQIQSYEWSRGLIASYEATMATSNLVFMGALYSPHSYSFYIYIYPSRSLIYMCRRLSTTSEHSAGSSLVDLNRWWLEGNGNCVYFSIRFKRHFRIWQRLQPHRDDASSDTYCSERTRRSRNGTVSDCNCSCGSAGKHTRTAKLSELKIS